MTPMKITSQRNLNIDQLCEASKLFTYRQLKQGLGIGDFSSLCFPGGQTSLRWLNFSVGLQARNLEPLDSLVILALQVTQGEDYRFNGVAMKEGLPFLLRAHHEDGCSMVMPDGMACRSFVFNKKFFHDSCRILFHRELPINLSSLAYKVSPTAHQELLSLSNVLYNRAHCQSAHDIFSQASSCCVLEKEIISQVLTAIYTQEDYFRLSSNRYCRLVHEVVDYMMANLTKHLHLVDFCRFSRVPQTTLNLAFQQVLTISPVAYFKKLRLHEAFCRLRRQEDIVTTIACDLGFYHLGQFSQDFKKQFGKLPSEVLSSDAAPSLNSLTNPCLKRKNL